MKHATSDRLESSSPVLPRENCTVSGASRRDFLKSLAVVGTGAMLPVNSLIAQVTPPTGDKKSGRIDVHNHITPPALIKAVGADALGGFAKWTPEKALEEMDAAGVTVAMASIPPHFDASIVDNLAHDCNEYAARLSQDHPGRFGVFAMMPMPHIDVTLREID